MKTKLVVMFLAIINFSIMCAADFEIINLKVEGLENPLGVETQLPRFSWQYSTQSLPKRGFKQQSYQIKVATSQKLIDANVGDMWDSKLVGGDDCFNLYYTGEELKSGTQYFWKVYSVYNGKLIASNSASFEMGLLNSLDWQNAQWIGKRFDAPKAIPAKAEKWTDYDIECDVKIISNSANIIFRAIYATELNYIAQIESGNEGCIKVFKNYYGKKRLISTIATHKPIKNDRYYNYKISVCGNTFNIYLDGVLLTKSPITDDSFSHGTIGVGALNASGEFANAIFDNFKVTNKNEILFFDDFSDSTLNNFQDLLFRSGGCSQPKDGALAVNAVNSLLEPKKGLEAPLLRKGFSTKNKIKKARAFVSGIGYYEMSINGNKIGNSILEPGYSRYDKVAYYSVHDITNDLKKDNVIGFELGRGWYGITTPTLWGEYKAKDWIGEPRLKALVKIEYEDGTIENIITDNTFKTSNSPVIFDSLKAGEYYDARKENIDWSRVGFNDSSWANAVTMNNSDQLNLKSQMFEPIREVETIQAQHIKRIDDNTYCVDFGRHIAGNVELKVKGKRGTKVRMQYAERMEEDGNPTIWRFAPAQTGCYQQDIYILKGGKEEKYQAKFSYKGFRYLIVTGFPGEPSTSSFTAKVINSDMEEVGLFESSNDLFNKISSASKRSIQSNMHSIPTDCPTFEKLGWACDDAAPFEAMAYYYDINNLYEKRLQDYADDITPDGAISDVLPSTWGLKDSDPAWNGSYIAIAWKMYEFYGNKKLLIRHYDNLKKYINRLTSQSTNYIITYNEDKGYGDWCPPDHVGGRGPEGLSLYHTVYYYWYTTLMSKIASEIGFEADTQSYNELAIKIKDAINARYFNSNENAYYFPEKAGGYRQSAQVLPLYFDIVPKEKAQLVADNLAKDIISRNNHFWVGILGIEYIAEVLMKYGYIDLAYKIHLQDDFPSIGNMIREGATTLWESYSLATTRSLNHKMYSTISEWLFRCVAGLGFDENVRGFKKAIIAPYPNFSQLQYANSEYNSQYGVYKSGWSYDNGSYSYSIVIPPNCSATVKIPVFSDQNIQINEGNNIVWKENKFINETSGIYSATQKPTHIEFEIGSGVYKFKTNP